jgi:signal transduction histidine kinase
MARIRIERRSCEVRIEVQDDGGGIPAANNITNFGVGLAGMRERARQLGGSLEIKSNGKGTTIVAHLPL